LGKKKERNNQGRMTTLTGNVKKKSHKGEGGMENKKPRLGKKRGTKKLWVERYNWLAG